VLGTARSQKPQRSARLLLSRSNMRRVAQFAMTLVATAVLLAPQAMAQAPRSTAPPPPQTSRTPEQRAQMKALHPKFTACHNKADTAKIGPADRYDFMKSCLAGKN